jgi:hypothetical protein
MLRVEYQSKGFIIFHDQTDFREATNLNLKATEIERIRNNQRRSRARRKEYIAQLEEKIRKRERQDGQTFMGTNLQHAIRENEVLRRLLQSIGIGDEFLNAYMRASEMAPKMSPAPLIDERCCQPTSCSSGGCSSSDSIQVCEHSNF